MSRPSSAIIACIFLYISLTLRKCTFVLQCTGFLRVLRLDPSLAGSGCNIEVRVLFRRIALASWDAIGTEIWRVLQCESENSAPSFRVSKNPLEPNWVRILSILRIHINADLCWYGMNSIQLLVGHQVYRLQKLREEDQLYEGDELLCRISATFFMTFYRSPIHAHLKHLFKS